LGGLFRLLSAGVWTYRQGVSRRTYVCVRARQLDDQREDVNHSASPSAPIIGAASIDRNSLRTSATASGSSTMIATSRRKSRLIAASARLPTTARRSSTSRILPCDFRPPRVFDPNTSTLKPAARLAL